MRLSAVQKTEVIRLVEQSDVPMRRSLDQLGIHHLTFAHWYRAYVESGYDGLIARTRQRRHWNRIPDRIRERVVQVALADPKLSPREIACKMTDRNGHFLSVSNVYRILKSHDLITGPAYEVMKASDSFKNPTRRVNELW